MRRNLKNSWRRPKSKEIPGFSVMSLSRPRSQLNTLQSSHNHHHQSGKIGWNVTVQSKTSQVEERKEKTSCKKFNILLRNQQKPSLPHIGRIVPHCARSFGGNQTRGTRRQTHKNETGTTRCGRTMAAHALLPPHAAEMRRRPTVGCCEVYRHGEIELRPGGRLSTSAFVGNKRCKV